MAEMNTIQTGAHQFTSTNDIRKYSLMLGGLNVTHDALMQYDPLITGYGRIFMVRQPLILRQLLPNKFPAYKHILEYGNTGVSGFSDGSVEFEQIQGGYVGRSFEIPKSAKDDMSSFTIKVFDFSGSPIREVNHTWINCVTDTQSGFAHYGGLIASGEIGYSQANHTAEFIYVVTDRTGMKVEYACLLANCFPGGWKNQQWDYNSGDHSFVETEIEFHCTKYESMDVNLKAKKLLQNYQILTNSLEWNSGLNANETSGLAAFKTENSTYYDSNTGKLDTSGDGNKPSNEVFFTHTAGKPFNDVSPEINGDIEITPSYTAAGNTSDPLDIADKYIEGE